MSKTTADVVNKVKTAPKKAPVGSGVAATKSSAGMLIGAGKSDASKMRRKEDTVPGTAKGGKPVARPAPAAAPKSATPVTEKPVTAKMIAAKHGVKVATASPSTRMPKAERQGQILTAAVKVAGAGGYIAMTRAAVATQAKVSECLITRYFATMDTLRDAVVQRAIEESRGPFALTPAMLRILAEALIAKHTAGAREAKKHKDAIVALLFK